VILTLFTKCGVIIFPRQIALLAMFMIIAVANVSASPGGPFATSNYAPLVQIFGLPPIVDVDSYRRNQFEFTLRTDMSSFFAVNESEREKSVMDGDSYRYTLSLSSKPYYGFQLQLAIPYIQYGGGTMDGFIDEFHKIFGFPEGGRDINPKDQQNYYYERDGQTRISLQKSQAGVGDTMISAQWSSSKPGNIRRSRYSWSASLKLPTGDPTTLLGSGGTDISLGFNASVPDKFWGYRYNFYFSMGGLWLGRSYYLSDLQRQLVAFSGLGFSVELYPHLNFKTQLYGHSDLYADTNVAEIGQESVQITIGGEWQISKQWRYDFALSEDLLIDAAPDVTFYSGLHLGF